MLTRRKRSEPEAKRPGQLTEPELRAKLEEVNRSIDTAFPDSTPPRAQMPGIIANAEALLQQRQELIGELGMRRTEPLQQAARQASRAPASSAGGALAIVARAAHLELNGERLEASRLSDVQGKELLGLAQRRRDGREPLRDDEQERYERLIGIAAGDEGLFARKRARAAARTKIAAYRREERRLPQAESLIAATMAEPDIYDYLHTRIRENVSIIDEVGNTSVGTCTERLLELEDVATLFVVVAAISENGGHEIEVSLHGSAGDGLPFLPVPALGHLRRNGFVVVRRQGPGFKVGLGPRVREVAARWGLALPPEEDESRAS